MKILFLCTAHNSLSQRLYLVLATSHDVTIEYALSDEVMISAAALAKPDLIICPFLTSLVPHEVFSQYLTLIVHPGPPGDAGPSSLDWLLLGDDGTVENASEALHVLDHGSCAAGRSHWGVTVLQATQVFDAGPVWAFDHFPVDVDQPGLTKSELYRGPVTRAAVAATLAAIGRIEGASLGSGHDFAGPRKTWESPQDLLSIGLTCSPSLQPLGEYASRAVGDNQPFQGGNLRHRPLLRALDRNFDPSRHCAQHISRRIRSADSQPGVLSSIFGRPLYLYGGQVEDDVEHFPRKPAIIANAKVLATRNEALCIATADQKGIWITHIRQPKTKADKALFPKVPAVDELVSLGILGYQQVQCLQYPLSIDQPRLPKQTLREIWIDFKTNHNGNRLAYLHFDFYNGAMSTAQCSRLIAAIDHIIAQSRLTPISAIILMGGTYFSNGIALNVIESAPDRALESWLNINRINDLIHHLLHTLPAHHILTIAALRGNAAAGGLALATACDFVIAGATTVLNPSYRPLGLHGSEYHTLTYPARSRALARHPHPQTAIPSLLRTMQPLTPIQAQSHGLIDYVFPAHGPALDAQITYHVDLLLRPGTLTHGPWKRTVDLSPAALAHARALELSEMARDCWGPRAVRYHTRRWGFVRKVRPARTPLRFARHRRGGGGGVGGDGGLAVVDEEEREGFDDEGYYCRVAEEAARGRLRREVWEELAAVVRGWTGEGEGEGEEGMSRLGGRGPRGQGSVALRWRSEPGEAGPEDPAQAGRSETLFSCYFGPGEKQAPLPTPPMSPQTDMTSPMFR